MVKAVRGAKIMIDLCVLLSGQNLESYVPLFFETLFRNCDTSRVCIHVVEKGAFYYTGDHSEEIPWYVQPDMKYYVPGVGDNVHQYLLKKVTDEFKIYEMHDASVFFRQSTPDVPIFNGNDDHANSLNWAIKNCGSNKWIIFCHSDMLFKRDIITPLIALMNDRSALVGVYNHCYAINRDAFYKVGVRFNAISSFRVIPTPHINGCDFEIKHKNDPACPADAKVIYGWDTGQLLELMMIAHGWVCDISGLHPLRDYVEHMGSGHGYTTEVTRESQKARLQDWMRQYGGQKL